MPTGVPTGVPTAQPTAQPTGQPTSRPTHKPSRSPTQRPSLSPTGQPVERPTLTPSLSHSPSLLPVTVTSSPTGQPTGLPSAVPTSVPTDFRLVSSVPTGLPTLQQHRRLTHERTITLDSILHPSGQPTGQPSAQPSAQPTGIPTLQHTRRPTQDPSSSPVTQSPTVAATNAPTTFPVSLLQQQSVSEVQLVGLSFHYQQEIQVSLCLLTVLRCAVTHESFLSQRIIIGNATGGSFRLVLQGSYVSSSQVSIGSSASTVQNTLQAIAATIPSNLVTCYYFSVTKKTAKNYIAFDVTFLTDQPSPQTLLQVVGYGLQGESGVQ